VEAGNAFGLPPTLLEQTFQVSEFSQIPSYPNESHSNEECARLPGVNVYQRDKGGEAANEE